MYKVAHSFKCLRIDDDDDGETKERSCYSFPSHDNIKIWDLPGHSTSSFQDIETYSDRFKLEQFDASLFFTKGYFKSNDLKLAKQFESMKKPYFLIRTSIDYDVENKKRRKKDHFNEKELLENIKEKILKNSSDLFCSSDMIYLVSNFHCEKWDFNELTAAIVKLVQSTSNKRNEDERKQKSNYYVLIYCLSLMSCLMCKIFKKTCKTFW